MYEYKRNDPPNTAGMVILYIAVSNFTDIKLTFKNVMIPINVTTEYIPIPNNNAQKYCSG